MKPARMRSISGHLARWMVWSASLLVPAHERAAWRREWEAELWHREKAVRESGAGFVRLGLRLVGPALGGFVHAGWLRLRNPGLDAVRQDFSFAVRAAWRSPVFSVAAVSTLGLGIAANVAVFVVVKGALWSPYPYAEPDRLAVVVTRDSGRPGESLLLSNPEIEELRATGVFESVSAFDWDPFNLRLADRTEWVGGGLVSASAFATLGVTPVQGRFFAEAEDDPGASPVVVLGESLWRSAFGAGEVVGETIWLDGLPFEVIGVAPAVVDVPEGAELWVPLRPTGAGASPDSHWLQAYGRLTAGVAWEQAGAALAALGARMAGEYPASNEGRTFEAIPLREYRTGGVRTAFLALVAAAGLVLLIVCANLTSLFLARFAGRRTELGMRRALGASGGRIARQLVTESLLVAVLGGAVGVVLGAWAVGALGRLVPEHPVWFDPSFDPFAIIVALLLAGSSAILFGLAPLPGGSARLMHGAVREARSATTRSRDVLVSFQVALSTILMVASVLLVRSLSRTLAVDPGFEPERRIAGTIQLPVSRYGSDESVIGFSNELLERLEGRADVESAAAVTRLPFRSGVNRVMWWEEGQGEDAFRENPQAELNSVTTGYFSTMGIELRAGRTFTSQDRDGSRDVVVVNSTLVRTHFSDRDPIGARISFRYPPRFMEIVGVVDDVKHQGLSRAARLQIYAPYSQRPTQRLTIVAKTRGQPAAQAGALRGLVRGLDPDLALSELRDLSESVRQSVWRLRLLTQVFWACGLFAIVLAAVGIASVVAQAVTRRTKEIGVRMALGARSIQVLGLVGRRIGWVVGAGLTAGTVAAFLAGRATRGVLFGVDPGNPRILAIVVAGFLFVAALAAWLPARRATSVDPVRALRSD